MKRIIIVVFIGLVFSFPKVSSAKDDCINRPIKQIAINSQLHGSFFYLAMIGGGSINQNFYYYLFVKSGKGYRLMKEDITDVNIIEGSFSPNLWTCEGWMYFGKHWQSDSFDEELKSGESIPIDVYVPSGSIIPTFRLDLNK